MSRGARALTLFAGIWSDIVAACPKADGIDWIAVWGEDKKHDWRRVDPDKMNIVSLMKLANWRPGKGDLTANSRAMSHFEDKDSEGYWRAVIDGISMDGLFRFATFVKEGGLDTIDIKTAAPSFDPRLNLPAHVPFTPQKPTPAEWGSW